MVVKIIRDVAQPQALKVVFRFFSRGVCCDSAAHRLLICCGSAYEWVQVGGLSAVWLSVRLAQGCPDHAAGPTLRFSQASQA